MKKIIAAISLGLAIMTFTGCNSAAKNWGGKMIIDLPAGEKLVMCDWDESDGLWYLTRPMHPDEKAESYTFQKDTTWGVLEGTITINEKE